MIIGAISSVSVRPALRAGLLLAWARSSTPSASRVPRTQEITVETTATIRVFRAACWIASLAISAPYHLNEAPPQAVGRPLALKDSVISTRIGT
ncbi:hypothetical protein D3C78_1581620 [compost metagenome]